MQLESGKTYRDRRGNSIEILASSDSTNAYSYFSSCGRIYTDKGVCIIGEIHKYDLIEEVNMANRLEVGKVYKAKNGKAVFITDINRDSNFAKVYNTITGEDMVLGITFDLDDPLGITGGFKGRTAELVTYNFDGSVFSNIDGGYRIVFGRTITIDGKEITISDESFKELKRSLLDD